MRGFILLALAFFLGLALYYSIEPEPAGIYVGRVNEQTCDTLIICPDGTYTRRIFNKGSQEAVIDRSSNWKIDDNRITFYDYFDNSHGPMNIKASWNFEGLAMVYSTRVKKQWFSTVIGSTDFTEEPIFEKVGSSTRMCNGQH